MRPAATESAGPDGSAVRPATGCLDQLHFLSLSSSSLTSMSLSRIEPQSRRPEYREREKTGPPLPGDKLPA